MVNPAIRGIVNRMTTIIPTKEWYDVPDEIVIPIEVIVPSILKDPLSIPDALVSSVREDLGISDVTQYVDFLYTS